MIFKAHWYAKYGLYLVTHELKHKTFVSAYGPMHGREIGPHAGYDLLGLIVFNKGSEVAQI